MCSTQVQEHLGQAGVAVAQAKSLEVRYPHPLPHPRGHGLDTLQASMISLTCCQVLNWSPLVGVNTPTPKRDTGVCMMTCQVAWHMMCRFDWLTDFACGRSGGNTCSKQLIMWRRLSSMLLLVTISRQLYMTGLSSKSYPTRCM